MGAYQCSICAKNLSSKSNLGRHKELHNEETPFTCKFCSKSFKMESYLEKHVPIHNTNKDY